MTFRRLRPGWAVPFRCQREPESQAQDSAAVNSALTTCSESQGTVYSPAGSNQLPGATIAVRVASDATGGAECQFLQVR